MSKASSPVRYRVVHRTEYHYSTPALLCHNHLRLAPRTLPYQVVESNHIEIEPKPTIRRPRTDRFGNTTEFFSIESQHNSMIVISESTVVRSAPDFNDVRTSSFEQIRSRLRLPVTEEDRVAQEFCFDSRYIKAGTAFADYARPSFSKHRSLYECLVELNTRIFKEFKYVPNSTHVATTPLHVLKTRQGVCQDFAHLMIACLRSLGLAARYVSGYLLTHPSPGRPKLVGSDASHAWASDYVGDSGWLDLDPTNNVCPGNEHITTAWGSDYADVAPIGGLLIGGGTTTLKVGVDVSPIPVKEEEQ